MNTAGFKLEAKTARRRGVGSSGGLIITIATIVVILLGCRTARAGVVINEIMYHAPDDYPDLEYVELYNSGEQPADLSGWKFTRGLHYQFPPGSRIDAHGYLVISRNLERFQEIYGFAAAGKFNEALSNRGEHLDLVDTTGRKVDSVKYSDDYPWPASADGLSASLERISPSADSASAYNWAASPLSEDGTKPAGTPGKQNSGYSANLPPVITGVKFSPANPEPDQPVTVESDVSDPDGLREVNLRYRVAGSGFEKDEVSVAMTRAAGNHFTAVIPGQKVNQILRFRVQGTDEKGSTRFYPAPHDPQPALSCFVSPTIAVGKIPFGFIINVGQPEFEAARSYRAASGQGGSPEEMQARMMGRMMLESATDLVAAWQQLTVEQKLGFDAVEKSRPVFTATLVERDKLVEQTTADPDFKEKMKDLGALAKRFQDSLNEALKPVLGEDQNRQFAEWQRQAVSDASGPPRFGPEMALKQLANLEGLWFRLSTRTDLNADQFKQLRALCDEATRKRSALMEPVKALMNGDGDWEALQTRAEVIEQDLDKQLKPLLTAAQSDELKRWRQRPSPFFGGRGGPKAATPPQGHSAFVFVDASTGRPRLFDFVNVPPRGGGFKVHFQKGDPFREMTGINLIFEGNDRFVLAEPLAYELYRRAGNAAELSDFVRLSIDGQPAGYHLLIEQPNRAFLRRNRLKDDGNLYKILWYERGVVGQHEKKTNLQTGHDDIVALVESLDKTQGDEQWTVIKKNFNVEQVMNYFAVNACLSHWDGFFNNYLAYHIPGDGGKWEMYPWDQDKTWGFHDGLSEGEVFSDMPLTFGMAGDVPPGWPKDRPPPTGFGAGPPWWRAGGFFSKPLLANPHFRRLYLARIREILESIYTEPVFFPIIDAMGERLKDEVRVRAEVVKDDPNAASERLQQNLKSLKLHLTKRRQFLLEQGEIKTAGKFDRAALK